MYLYNLYKLCIHSNVRKNELANTLSKIGKTTKTKKTTVNSKKSKSVKHNLLLFLKISLTF